MFSRLMFSAMLMLSSTAFAATLDSSDSAWLTGSDDTLLSNTDWTLNSAVAPDSFNQPLSPSGLDASLFDSAQLPTEISLSSFTTNKNIDTTSDALLWDLDSSSGGDIGILATDDDSNKFNNLFLDDPLQLADCSTSSGEQSLSALDNPLAKTRLRRRDDGKKCTNPAVTPHTSSQSSSSAADDPDQKIVEELFAFPEFRAIAALARQNENNNFVCFVLSDGLLPWGVCSTGLDKDQVPLGGQILIANTPVTLWALRNALFRMPFFSLFLPFFFFLPFSPPLCSCFPGFFFNLERYVYF